LKAEEEQKWQKLDFADVQTVMSHRGMALLGVGEFEGEDAAVEAMKNAIESPLLDNMSINGALGVLIHFNIHPNCPLSQISDAMGIVYDNADEDAHVIFGTTTNEDMPENKVKITIVATGDMNIKKIYWKSLLLSEIKWIKNYLGYLLRCSRYLTTNFLF